MSSSKPGRSLVDYDVWSAFIANSRLSPQTYDVLYLTSKAMRDDIETNDIIDNVYRENHPFDAVWDLWVQEGHKYGSLIISVENAFDSNYRIQEYVEYLLDKKIHPNVEKELQRKLQGIWRRQYNMNIKPNMSVEIRLCPGTRANEIESINDFVTNKLKLFKPNGTWEESGMYIGDNFLKYISKKWTWTMTNDYYMRFLMNTRPRKPRARSNSPQSSTSYIRQSSLSKLSSVGKPMQWQRKRPM